MDVSYLSTKQAQQAMKQWSERIRKLLANHKGKIRYTCPRCRHANYRTNNTQWQDPHCERCGITLWD